MKKKVTLFTVLLLLVSFMAYAQFSPTVERPYMWYAEEKITVSTTILGFTDAEYDYLYGLTRIDLEDPNDVGGPETTDFVLNELISGNTSGAIGKIIYYDDANDPTYFHLDIYYGTFANNETITADAGGLYQVNESSYSRGDIGPKLAVSPQIAEVHVLDNSIITTMNGNKPVYSATDASCVGKKYYEGDTFYIFGTDAIKKFKMLRNGSSDAVVYVKYGN